MFIQNIGSANSCKSATPPTLKVSPSWQTLVHVYQLDAWLHEHAFAWCQAAQHAAMRTDRSRLASGCGWTAGESGMDEGASAVPMA
jgi:hypothetical protein